MFVGTATSSRLRMSQSRPNGSFMKKNQNKKLGCRRETSGQYVLFQLIKSLLHEEGEVAQLVGLETSGFMAPIDSITSLNGYRPRSVRL